jgi:hypothetical protein
MYVLKNQSKLNLALLLFSSLLVAMPVMAGTDFEAQQSFAKLRANDDQVTDHTAHANPVDKNQEFHGVFYGFLPCSDCTGIKATLSLKQNNNYLLVTQSAKESSREFYEKGKYSWNDKDNTVVLTPSKGGENTRYYHIENEGKLIQLNDDGTRMASNTDRYILERSDTTKAREVHMH